MRITYLVLALLITGCDCDPICQSHRETKELLSEFSDEDTVIAFLEKYSGEGPGSEKFSIFVKWGIENQDKYLSLMHHSDMTRETHSRVFYAISDMGLSDQYCSLYMLAKDSDHLRKMRKSILGCSGAS